MDPDVDNLLGLVYRQFNRTNTKTNRLDHRIDNATGLLDKEKERGERRHMSDREIRGGDRMERYIDR